MSNHDRKAVAESSHGVRPYFYTEEDVEAFCRVLAVLGVRSAVFNPITLHTYFPRVFIPPLSEPCREAEHYGFTRLDLTHTLLRPNMSNVQSCHAVSPASNVPLGNLGYLSNPHWASYGIFTEENSNATLDVPVPTVENKLAIPNLIASANVLLGYNSTGEPSAMISRVYGDVTQKALLTRLVEYLSYCLGLQVYVEESWGRNTEFNCFEPVREREKAKTLWTRPIESQIILTSGSSRLIPHRYSDIEDVLEKTVSGGNPYIVEQHEVLFWRSAKQTPAVPAIPKNIRAGILEELKEYHVGDTVQLYPQYPKCKKCGYIVSEEGAFINNGVYHNKCIPQATNNFITRLVTANKGL
jgi:hypothetical protein